ncbi:hypothetical protein BN996_00685 [Haloferax massiliensis]|uniref:Uncharacterized protein n=1 Tax=Haloferax massiliensis TaxID=1476858 RepID=A0A0D6JNP4_9EURY|nr:hypothetical protein BN996_00685 [Haloferax massiliensis]
MWHNLALELLKQQYWDFEAQDITIPLSKPLQ